MTTVAVVKEEEWHDVISISIGGVWQVGIKHQHGVNVASISVKAISAGAAWLRGISIYHKPTTAAAVA